MALNHTWRGGRCLPGRATVETDQKFGQPPHWPPDAPRIYTPAFGRLSLLFLSVALSRLSREQKSRSIVLPKSGPASWHSAA